MLTMLCYAISTMHHSAAGSMMCQAANKPQLRCLRALCSCCSYWGLVIFAPGIVLRALRVVTVMVGVSQADHATCNKATKPTC